MSEYENVAERLRWGLHPEDNLLLHAWYKAYSENRLNPEWSMNTHVERLLAAAYGLVKRWHEDEKWIEELERTAKDYE